MVIFSPSPYAFSLFRWLDLVAFGFFKQKKGIVGLELPRVSQAYQITKVIYALELATVSRKNRVAFRCAGLVATLQIVPPVTWAHETNN
jgi:hypothetical protein